MNARNCQKSFKKISEEKNIEQKSDVTLLKCVFLILSVSCCSHKCLTEAY